MARNLAKNAEQDYDVELFEKLNKSNKPRFNSKIDCKERIKKQRREKQKMRENAYKDIGELNV